MHASVLARLLHVLQCLAVPAHVTVQFTPRGAVVRRGRPSGAWVADCADVARDLGVHGGRIDVLGPRTALTLRFSPDVPERCRQRLRNVLGVHRHALLPPNVR
jgi:hypothetical protein